MNDMSMKIKVLQDQMLEKVVMRIKLFEESICGWFYKICFEISVVNDLKKHLSNLIEFYIIR